MKAGLLVGWRVVDAVIFDMDGLLIDTEPIWRKAEIEVFGRLGIHLSEEQCLQTMGVRIAEIVAMYYQRYGWAGPSPDEVTAEIQEAVIHHVEQEGEPLPGAERAMRLVDEAGLPIAIASSSSLRLIQAVITRLGLEAYIQVACSGDDEPEGKPHPAVYLTTARRLHVPPERCLALEDSPNGVLAAKAAGMTCIAVPDPHLAADLRFQQADLILPSLEAFDETVLQATEASRS